MAARISILGISGAKTGGVARRCTAGETVHGLPVRLVFCSVRKKEARLGGNGGRREHHGHQRSTRSFVVSTFTSPRSRESHWTARSTSGRIDHVLITCGGKDPPSTDHRPVIWMDSPEGSHSIDKDASPYGHCRSSRVFHFYTTSRCAFTFPGDIASTRKPIRPIREERRARALFGMTS